MPRFKRPILEDPVLLGKVYDASGYPILQGGDPFAFVDAGYTAGTNGSASQSFPTNAVLTNADVALASYAVTDDSDQLCVVAAGRHALALTLSADPSTTHGLNWAAVRAGAQPTMGVVAAGIHTTVGGGAGEDITLTGVKATDICIVQIHTNAGTPRTLVSAICAANKITVTFSGDPSTTHKVNYMVLRPLGGFTPSHRILAAGITAAPTSASTTQVVSVEGLVATDPVFAVYNVTDDTDTVTKVAAGAGAFTAVVSANPLAAHSFGWVALRAIT